MNNDEQKSENLKKLTEPLEGIKADFFDDEFIEDMLAQGKNPYLIQGFKKILEAKMKEAKVEESVENE